MLECRTGHSTDPALRRQASSGGGISALLVHLLETGAVDRVIQIAASDAVPVANETVVSVTPGEIFTAAGSRYAPSAPLARLEEMLETPGKAAFVGKPCDVAALRAIAKRDPRVDAKIPYLLSFFCAGVPSQTGAEAVVAKLGVAPDDLASFRYRGDGWPGYATATRRDGSAERMSYDDSWGDILTKHVQFRCKICPDGVGARRRRRLRRRLGMRRERLSGLRGARRIEPDPEPHGDYAACVRSRRPAPRRTACG